MSHVEVQQLIKQQNIEAKKFEKRNKKQAKTK